MQPPVFERRPRPRPLIGPLTRPSPVMGGLFRQPAPTRRGPLTPSRRAQVLDCDRGGTLSFSEMSEGLRKMAAFQPTILITRVRRGDVRAYEGELGGRRRGGGEVVVLRGGLVLSHDWPVTKRRPRGPPVLPAARAILGCERSVEGVKGIKGSRRRAGNWDEISEDQGGNALPRKDVVSGAARTFVGRWRSVDGHEKGRAGAAQETGALESVRTVLRWSAVCFAQMRRAGRRMSG